MTSVPDITVFTDTFKSVHCIDATAAILTWVEFAIILICKLNIQNFAIIYAPILSRRIIGQESNRTMVRIQLYTILNEIHLKK